MFWLSIGPYSSIPCSVLFESSRQCKLNHLVGHPARHPTTNSKPHMCFLYIVQLHPSIPRISRHSEPFIWTISASSIIIHPYAVLYYFLYDHSFFNLYVLETSFLTLLCSPFYGFRFFPRLWLLLTMFVLPPLLVHVSVAVVNLAIYAPGLSSKQ